MQFFVIRTLYYNITYPGWTKSSGFQQYHFPIFPLDLLHSLVWYFGRIWGPKLPLVSLVYRF
jgi:hypothetical protein